MIFDFSILLKFGVLFGLILLIKINKDVGFKVLYIVMYIKICINIKISGI